MSSDCEQAGAGMHALTLLREGSSLLRFQRCFLRPQSARLARMGEEIVH